MLVPSRLASFLLVFLQSADPPLVLRDVNVVDVEHGTLVPGRSVLVRDGSIARVASTAELAPPEGALVIEGHGRWLAPGLIDAHVHLYDDRDPEDLWLYLANGVTTVRSMHGGPYQLALRERVRRGELVGPRILTTGPTTATLRVHTVDDALRTVREQKAAGFDAIKMYGDGSDTMPRTTYHALIEAAHAAGMPVIGHAPRNLPFSAVLEEHQDSIDHMEEIVYTDEGLARLVGPYVGLQFGRQRFEDHPELTARVPDFAAELAPEIAALARRVKAAGLTVTPTLITFGTIQAITDEGYAHLLEKDELRYVDAIRLDQWTPEHERFRNGNWKPVLAFVARYLRANHELQLALTRAFHEAGVPILAGTDSPFDLVVPGFSLHDELALFVRAGLSPAAALRAATLDPARAMHLGDSGVIAEGARADLVLLGADPLRDAGATRAVEGVVLRGRWLAREELDAHLAGIETRQRRIAPFVARLSAAVAAGDAAAAVKAWTDAGEDRARLAGFAEDRLNQLGYRYLGAGRLDDALDVLRRNTELFPRSSNAWDSLGEVLHALKRADEALQAYEHALELDPDNADARASIDRIVQES